jgi:NAD(P)-dependent dehydrogenase (short-subunit alcohol dehydrogenase family)
MSAADPRGDAEEHSGADHRVALVTGANRGIGYAISRQLAVRGMTVVIASRELTRGIGRGCSA